jgi:hypothetical protein
MNLPHDEFVLITVKGFDKPPTMAVIANTLGISIDDMDQDYGANLIDPRLGEYCIQLKAGAVPLLTAEAQYTGPWASPRIDTS